MSTTPQWKANPAFPEYDSTRDSIILAAAEVIEEVGVDKLRLDKVGKLANCARQTLYRYFNSKEELVQAVVIHFTLENARDIIEHIQGITDPRERLVEILHRGSSNLRKPKFAIFLDLRDSKYLATLSLERIPETLTTAFGEMLTGDQADEILRARALSSQDVIAWIIMQTYSLALFDMVGKDPEREKAFIDKLVVGDLFSA